LKILHVIPSISPARGGTSRAIIDMVHALQSKGIDIEIATTNDDGDNLLNVPLGECILSDRIPTYFFARFSPRLVKLREFAFSGSLTIWLSKHIIDYDLIHVHALFSYPATIAMTIARWQKVPYLVTPHGLLCKWSLAQSRQKKQIYLKLIERSNLDHARSIHLTCQQELDDVLTLNFKSPIFILPLALTEIPSLIPDAAKILRQNLNCPSDEPIILFLSRLHSKKGLDYLIPALGKLQDRRFTLIIAGTGTPTYQAEIHRLLLTAGITKQTKMLGFVAGKQKDLLIQGADLFALTSHSENFGIAVLEALVVGTPVLVTPGVGLADVIRTNQLGYVADLDVAAIADTLNSYLIDPTLAKLMAIRARKFASEHYNWTKIATDLIQIYHVVLEDRSSRYNRKPN
jgi:glycosyltransferase involved in cell wall biosynthesis